MPTIRSKQTTTLKITRVKGTSSTGKETHDYVNLSVNPELADGECFPLGASSAICSSTPLTVSAALTQVRWQKNTKGGLDHERNAFD